MRALILPLLPAAVVAVGEDTLPAGSALSAWAAPAVAEVDPLAETQQYLQLPELAFDLRIRPRCAEGAGVRSVVISVADTRLRHEGNELDESSVLETTLVVPRRQAGQLRVEGFCRVGDTGRQSRLELGAVFTARLSLRCHSEDREWIAYATLPLDIVLECRAPPADPDPDPESPPNQSDLRF